MTNYRLITEAIDIVNKYYEAEGICELTRTIDAQAFDWYNHSEICDAEMLAAAVMNFGYYRPGTTWTELEQLREFYFLTEPVFTGVHSVMLEIDAMQYEEYLAQENFSIAEIEAAQRDMLWQ